MQKDEIKSNEDNKKKLHASKLLFIGQRNNYHYFINNFSVYKTVISKFHQINQFLPDYMIQLPCYWEKLFYIKYIFKNQMANLNKAKTLTFITKIKQKNTLN